MKGFTKNKIGIIALEKRLMLDASLGALISSTVLAEDTVNATPQVLDADVSVTGTTTDFDGEALTISTTGGIEDQLTIIDEGNGIGEIGFDGTNINYGGTLIGTISSNGVNGADLTIDLNASASKAAIERLIENITYQNNSDTPTASRTINVALGGLFSEDISVTVVAQNDDPVASANTGVTLNEGATTTIGVANLDVTDPDDADIDIVFSVTSATANGQLELTTNVGVAITSFTRDDIVNNRVVYVHDGSETTADSFDFTVTDGDVTLASDTFNITVTGVNDPLTLDTNTGVTVFQNLSTTIGADPVQFGTELIRNSGVGNYASWDGTIDNKSIQFSLIFTTPAGAPTGVPGEVLFESGGASVGVGLVLNSSFNLEFYAGASAGTPELSGDPLLANTQYAVVIEIDQASDEIRMHFEQASNFNWYGVGRPAQEVLTGYTATDHSGSGNAGVGQMNPEVGGYNGSRSGVTTFQGTIDSDVVVTEMPSVTNPNNELVANDFDTSADNIVYTITTDVVNGSLTRAGVALGAGDTFTQADLDTGLISYANTGGLVDSFDFSVTDGTTVIAGNTFNITVDTSNVAPEILTTTTILDEDFEGGTSGWNNNTTTTNTTLSEFWGRFNRNVHTADNQELFQTFATSGTQDYIVVEFDFYELDTWDNEYFYLFVNDTNVLGNNHRLRWNVFERPADGVSGDVSYSVQETTEALGFIGFNASYYEQTYHYTLVIENSDPTLKLGFGSSLNSTNVNDEAFGIDNLKITEVKSGGVDVQEFYLAEDAANNASVGTIGAIDANAGQTISFAATGGTGAGIFSVNAGTGEIRVTDNSTLDFETTTSYTLDIEVSDGALSSTQTIVINMLDVMENTAPTYVAAGPFSIAEDAANNDDVGTVTTADAEGDTVVYRIIGGNTNNAFKINTTTGLIEVRDNSTIDFDTLAAYNLRIRATDDNDLARFRDQTIRVNITDVDEAPSLDIEYVIEAQNAGVIYSSDTGNFYKVITPNKTYVQALAFAETELLNGVEGHLATITSLAEYVFVRDYASPSHIRIALSDGGEEGKWIWTAGPEAGTQITQGNVDAIGLFNRWLGSEPNSGPTRNSALFHSNSWWYDNWEGAYDSLVEWEGEDIINNSFYNVNHSNADASDVNVGDSVGFVQGVDPEGDALDFSIQGGNGDGIFEIDTATGELRILDTTNLDATVNDTYVLTVRATENAGVKFDEINITIKFNDALSISANNTLDVNEASSSVITTADLNIADLDGVAADTVFRVTTLPIHGELEHSTNPGFQISSFTLDDIQNGRISYVHGGAEITSDSFEFLVTDGGETLTANTFNINVINVNDAPIIAANTGAPVTEGSNVTITTAMLDSTDSDDTPTGLTYTASAYANGHIEVSGVTQNTFTQDDIDNNRVVFVHDGGEGATSFNFSLADGGEDAAVPATGTFAFTVTPVNDSPTVTTNTGTTVVEGAPVTITTAMLNATDPDDSGADLTYTLSNIINGQVELSTNLGTPIITFTQADLDANRVVFVHDGGESNARFDVLLADGGEDSATTDTATFNLTRIPVNDSPIVGTNLGSSVNQNSVVLIKNAVLAASDPDDSGVGLTFTVTGTTNGQVEFVSTPNVAITSFTQDDIDNSRILFRHSGPPGVADFDFSIADGGEDASVAATGTFNLTVDNTNDAPIISTNTGPTVLEGSTTTLTTAMLDSFDPDDFGVDLTWTASNLLNGIIQVNGATQNTFTQADLDNGLVTFIHDDSETTIARFDIQVADGGEDAAAPATGTFTMTVTPVNEGPTLIVNDGSPNVVDFNDYTVDAFDAFQDGQGGDPTTSNTSPDGSVLTISGNAWKKIDIPYTLTANTVLSFEFFSDDIGEIFGIGFDDASGFGGGVNGYQLGGTQVWSGMDQSFRTYSQGDGWVRFDLPIGTDYTGVMNQLVFVLDDDATPTGDISFRNVNFYESDQAVDVDEGGTFNITNAHLNFVDVDDNAAGVTFTASNLSNGVVQVSGATQNTFTQDDINNNRVTFVHDGSDTLNAGFDLSLIDGGEDGTTADTGSFTLVVNPINDAPVVSVNTGGAMLEGANLTITSAMLNEADSDDDGANLTYTASALSNGHIEVGGSTQNTFTQDDIDNNRVIFVHDGSETIASSFNFSLADGGENGAAADTGTFNITVTPQNDASTITTNTGATFNEGASLTITTAMLNSADPDDATTQRTYTASNLTNGHIEVNGAIQNTFTQDDINNNRVAFIHDDSQTTAASFDISLADGLEHGAAADTDTFSMVINPRNDAVSIVTNTGATMNEGTSLTITTAMLNSADVDDTPAQRTYTASALANGHIEVSGVTQNTFTQDDINNNRVVFVHDDSQTTAASFNISLADGLEHGAVADTDTFNITVNPVNDAPVIVNNTGGTVLEGGATFFSNARLAATDVDNINTTLTYTITALPAGLIENTNTASTLTIGSTFTQGDIDNGFIRYTHDGGETLSQAMSFTVDDGAITLGASTFTWSVTPVNDTPHALGLTAMEVEENSDIGTWISDIYALDVDLPGDSFAFSIMADPDSKFAIVGNQLFVNAELDFETAETHSVTIRANDGNGGFLDRTMTINVLDFNETPFIAAPEGGQNQGGFDGFAIEEEKRRQPAGESLIRASLSGNDVLLSNAFYGEDGLNQILRQNTTFTIREMTQDQDIIENFDPVQQATQDEIDDTSNEEMQEEVRFTSIREMLEAMENFGDDEDSGDDEDDNTNLEFYNLYDQFEDVLTYHEQRKAKLREALMS